MTLKQKNFFSNSKPWKYLVFFHSRRAYSGELYGSTAKTYEYRTERWFIVCTVKIKYLDAFLFFFFLHFYRWLLSRTTYMRSLLCALRHYGDITKLVCTNVSDDRSHGRSNTRARSGHHQRDAMKARVYVRLSVRAQDNERNQLL